MSVVRLTKKRQVLDMYKQRVYGKRDKIPRKNTADGLTCIAAREETVNVELHQRPGKVNEIRHEISPSV